MSKLDECGGLKEIHRSVCDKCAFGYKTVEALLEHVKELERRWAAPRDVEELSIVLHDIYQKEAHRQNRAYCPDDYNKLSEQTKEYDRVLARYILQRESETSERERAVYSKAHGELIQRYEAQLKPLRELAERVDRTAKLMEMFDFVKPPDSKAWKIIVDEAREILKENK